MRPPIYVRALTDEEKEAAEVGLRSSDAFVLRRCQILLASARGERAPEIARHLGCDDQTVREVIQGFNAEGLAVLQRKSSRPHHIAQVLDADAVEQIQAMLNRSPRTYGLATSLWTLDLLAQTAFEQGVTDRRVTGEAVRQALLRLDIRWRRAKQWITSPDPRYNRKKAGGTD